jgi:hypothetical protein
MRRRVTSSSTQLNEPRTEPSAAFSLHLSAEFLTALGPKQTGRTSPLRGILPWRGDVGRRDFSTYTGDLLWLLYVDSGPLLETALTGQSGDFGEGEHPTFTFDSQEERMTAAMTPSQGSPEFCAPVVDVAKVVEIVTAMVTELTIEIPEIVVLPTSEVTFGYHDFDLQGLESIARQPVSDQIMVQRLRDDARTYLARAVEGAREQKSEHHSRRPTGGNRNASLWSIVGHSSELTFLATPG